MELMIAERIKKYRRDREMTQDALAQVLGVSPQSVSKWETGDGYPDITLLPAIANYFEVTVDELIGNDEISAQEDVQKNYFGVMAKASPEERLALALKYHKKYPRNWHIATSLMHEITRKHRDKLKQYMPMLHEICERILKECPDSISRRNAVRSMCMVCGEDEVGKWLTRDTQFWHEERLDIYEERYKLMGDEAGYWACRYAGNFLRAAETVQRMWEHRSYIGNPAACAEWHRMYLHMLDGIIYRRAEEDIPDGWLGEYGTQYKCLAAAYFGLGDKEMGYACLEKALAANERWAKIPTGTPMELGNPLLFGETKLLKDDWHIVSESPKHMQIFMPRGIRSQLKNLAAVMTAKSGWEWFDSVRGEERWNAILIRAQALETE